MANGGLWHVITVPASSVGNPMRVEITARPLTVAVFAHPVTSAGLSRVILNPLADEGDTD